MKIPNKHELQQTAFNHLLDIDFKDFMNLKENALQNQFFLVNYTTIGSRNPSYFRDTHLGSI